MKNICKITNDAFSFVMEVDGQTISFNGFGAAEYFHRHYRGLGYEVQAVGWEFEATTEADPCLLQRPAVDGCTITNHKAQFTLEVGGKTYSFANFELAQLLYRVFYKFGYDVKAVGWIPPNVAFESSLFARFVPTILTARFTHGENVSELMALEYLAESFGQANQLAPFVFYTREEGSPRQGAATSFGRLAVMPVSYLQTVHNKNF